MVTLGVLLDCMLEAQEVADEACQALMADDAGVPLVEVLQHPWVRVRPSTFIATEVGVDDLHLCHTRRQLAESEQKNLFWVDSVAAGSVKWPVGMASFIDIGSSWPSRSKAA